MIANFELVQCVTREALCQLVQVTILSQKATVIFILGIIKETHSVFVLYI